MLYLPLNHLNSIPELQMQIPLTNIKYYDTWNKEIYDPFSLKYCLANFRYCL